MRRRTLVLLGAVLAAVAMTALAGRGGSAPAEDTLVSGSRPRSTNGLDRLIARFQERARTDPYGAGDRSLLAGLYLQRARETGDYRDVLHAEAAARRSLELRPERNAGTWGALSLSLMEQHRFLEAREAAEKLVAAEPRRAGFRAHLAEVDMELGDYARAAAVFASLKGKRNDLDVAPRLARWLEITAHDEEARRLLYSARDQALRGEIAPERAAWFHLRVGDFELRHGRPREAEAALRAGLAAHPGDYRLLAAMARLQAARGDYPRAIEYGEAVLERLLDPSVLILMSDAATQQGDTAKAAEYAHVLQLAIDGQKTAYHRDWGLFLLDRGMQLTEVLRRAQAELETRKDVYGYDLLAWALHRQGRDREALGAMRQALRTGARDPMLLYHAGMIEHALGRDDAARAHLSAALRINPRFHVAHAPVARATLDAIRGPWYQRIALRTPRGRSRHV